MAGSGTNVMRSRLLVADFPAGVTTRRWKVPAAWLGTTTVSVVWESTLIEDPEALPKRTLRTCLNERPCTLMRTLPEIWTRCVETDETRGAEEALAEFGAAIRAPVSVIVTNAARASLDFTSSASRTCRPPTRPARRLPSLPS